MADTRCLGRLTKWSKRLPFGDNRHYFTLEYRCTKEAAPHGDSRNLCIACQKRPLQHKEVSHILHGRITDPIPESSTIYGGARYVEFCKKFGEPSVEHVETAEEAHKLAIEGYPDPGMAKEGRTKQKALRQSKSETTLASSPSTLTSAAPIPAHAIEITVKPQLVEVEQVEARRTRMGEKEVLVDTEGRIWELDDKFCVRGYLGLMSSVSSSAPTPASITLAQQVRSDT
jgi:hypothetical protein